MDFLGLSRIVLACGGSCLCNLDIHSELGIVHGSNGHGCNVQVVLTLRVMQWIRVVHHDYDKTSIDSYGVHATVVWQFQIILPPQERVLLGERVP